MFHRLHTIAALVALSIVIASGAFAWACKCRLPPDTKTALADSAAVFTGKVTRIAGAGENDYQVTLTVDQFWKGVSTREVVVRTSKQSASCGYNFEMGKSYLLYCSADENKVLHCNICSRTRGIAEAKEDLADLGPGQKP